MLDLLIVGGSAAGGAAAIYAARRNLQFKILSGDFGGEVARSGEIGNWPGIIQTDGITLAESFRRHVAHYDVPMDLGVHVQSIQKKENYFLLTVKKDGVVTDEKARTVIVATGVHPRRLNIPGEKEYEGKGVSFCTVCDGPLFRGKRVVTIGGGNSAMESALMLAGIASSVTVVTINPTFTGETILLEKMKRQKNVRLIYNAATTHISGVTSVTDVVVRDKESGKEESLPADGVFVHIGAIPNSDLVPPEVTKNAFGEIVVNERCATAVPGLFAAGDVTFVPYKQIVIAAGHGVTAALSAIDYLNKFSA